MKRLSVFLYAALVFAVVSCSRKPTPTATLTQTPTLLPTLTPPVISVLADIALRSGPGMDYGETVQISRNSSLILSGVTRGRDCNQWLLVRTPDGDEGWVRSPLVNLEVEIADIPPAPKPTPLAVETPVPDTCTEDLALVRINNNYSRNLEVFVAGAEPGFALAIGGGNSQFICVAPGQYCYDITDGVNHETGGLFFPGGQCTCWQWGGPQPQPGSCQCPEDPSRFQRP